MLTRQSLLLLWGLTVTAAYLLTQYFGNTQEDPHGPILWTWAGAMALPLLLTLLLGHRRNALIWVWAGATALALGENFWVHGAEAKAAMHFSFHALWFAFGAAGFAYTAAVVDGTTRQRLYGLAAVLNLAGTVLVLVDKELLKGVEYVVLALIQGVPMLVDLPLRKRQEARAAQ